MIKSLLLSWTLLFACSSDLWAQNPNYDRCEIGVVDLRTGKSRSLGVFETVMGEEELTVKSFRFPGTKLFIVGSVFYTDESMASDQGADSVSLELTLSRNRQPDVLRSLTFADAEMPSAVPVGRVTMLVKIKGKPQLVGMECRRHVRR